MRPGQHIIIAACVIFALCASAPGSAGAQTVDELYAAGVKARLAQRFDEAADRLQRVLRLQPKNTDAMVQLGFVELARGNLGAARQYFLDTLSLAPTYLDASFGLAEIEYREGNLDKARSLVEPVVEQQPGNQDAATLLQSVRKAIEAREQTARSKMAERQARAKADIIARLMEEGRKQRINGKFLEAGRSYRKVIGLDPRNTDALVALGLVAGFQGNYPESERYFDRVLAIDRTNLDARLGKVRLAIWQNDIKTARLLLDRIRVQAPANGEVLLLEGRISFLEEDNERAEGAYRTALKLNPSDADALIGLGDVLRAGGDDASARLLYQQALKLRPGSEEITTRLAAPVPRKWRLDLATEISELSSGLGTWTDSLANLSYRASPKVTVGTQARVATRYGQTDEQLEARVDYSPVRPLSVYGLVAVTPEADFLAEYSVGTGGTWVIETKRQPVGALLFGLDFRYDEYALSEIWTVAPSAQVFLFNDRFALTGRWVHVEDDANNSVDGYIVRGDLRMTDTLQAFAGYSDAPEISEGVIVDTQTIFTGVAIDVSDDVTLRANYAYETRPTFDRNIFGFAVTVRF